VAPDPRLSGGTVVEQPHNRASLGWPTDLGGSDWAVSRKGKPIIGERESTGSVSPFTGTDWTTNLPLRRLSETLCRAQI
jgi:hypothetical protein